LALEDQHRLMAWLERGDRPRVISTSRVSLLPIVQAGMFIESLYYRLNTLCIDLTG
jgi:transcriptional regulator of aromatic amino acid metabolism